MRNLSLIDRPEMIAGLEINTIMVIAIVSMAVIAPLAFFVNVLFFVVVPGVLLIASVWVREKTRNKRYGFPQRYLYGKLNRYFKKEHGIAYVKI